MFYVSFILDYHAGMQVVCVLLCLPSLSLSEIANAND